MIRNSKSSYHIPVLLKEAIDGLKVKPNGKYIDATIGGGGHAFEILKRGGVLLGIDIDQDAIDYVKEKLEINKDIFLERGNFRNLKSIARKCGFDKVDGILFDLGVSSHQLDTAKRGFSFRSDAPLDMRMDKESNLTAQYIVNKYSKEALYEIFSKYSEELDSRAIASAIVRARALKPIKTTRELAKILPRPTLVFQALRIAVNEELDNLIEGLHSGADILKKGGRMVVISFHSLEDRIVKLRFDKNKLKMITKKPIIPNYEEIKVNPRSRSAKLRIFEKI